MKRIIKLLYKYLPKSIITKIGSSKYLKSIRDYFLRTEHQAILTTEKVKWRNGTFYFTAPIRTAVKAKNKGIENRLIRNSLKLLTDYKIEKPVILDIGANYGFVSLALQSNLSSGASVYSFEPHPEIYQALSNSITKSEIKNISVHNVAVGNESKMISINLAEQSSNILNSDNFVVKKIISVQQIKLDDFVSEKKIIPNYIKIDVDGYELQVLKGLEETIKNHKPIMVIESNDDYKILDFLKAFDYKLFDLDLKEFTDIPNNIFCLP